MTDFLKQWCDMTTFAPNRFHALVAIYGNPVIGEGVSISFMSEINANGATVRIGDHCDIASFVAINCADSHQRCIGLRNDIERKDITLEDHVFVGSHCVIKGGAHIGHHSVVAAGTIVDAGYIRPYSLVSGNPMLVRPGFYSQHSSER
jgi:acetyltransferase-like isoleucine patch superfamily enzyme